jgi:hypothetical protein
MIYEHALSLIFGAIGGGLVSWLFYRKQAQWEAIREAGLLALETVDAVYSNIDWVENEQPVSVVKQPVDIASARRALNLLSLSCKNPSVIVQYLKTLGITTPSGKPKQLAADAIVDLRNAIRVELGFGQPLQLDKSKAFIAKLAGCK